MKYTIKKIAGRELTVIGSFKMCISEKIFPMDL